MIRTEDGQVMGKADASEGDKTTIKILAMSPRSIKLAIGLNKAGNSKKCLAGIEVNLRSILPIWHILRGSLSYL